MARNPAVKRTGQQESFTPDQMEMLNKCLADPLYFTEKFVRIVHPVRGEVPFVMYDYQREMIETMHSNRFSTFLTSRQAGKCCTADTYITVRHPEHTKGEAVRMTMGAFHELMKA